MYKTYNTITVKTDKKPTEIKRLVRAEFGDAEWVARAKKIDGIKYVVLLYNAEYPNVRQSLLEGYLDAIKHPSPASNPNV